MIKAYLAAPIFTERDRNFNELIKNEILERCPNIDLYLAQDNKSINDKTGCATSADIYVGDVRRLKEADLLITICSGDMPPIGSSYETAYFCGLCETNPNKRIIALYDDSREGYHTASKEKNAAMMSGIAEAQTPYINLLAVGYIKKWGYLHNNHKDFIDEIERQYKIGFNDMISGIYKITNLKNNLVYIGQSINIHERWKYYYRKDVSNPELKEDIDNLGLEYFKFEIIEPCTLEELDEKEKYWINYYDSYNNGYNNTSGGSGNKENIITEQCIPVYEYDLEGNFIKEYCSIASAARAKNLKSGSDISRCAAYKDPHHQSGGSMWRYIYEEKIEPYAINYTGMNVYAYDINTREFVKAYQSMVDAGKQLTGKRQPHITDVCNGKRKSCAGFIWAYEYFDRLPDDYFNNYNIQDEQINLNEY